MKLWIGNCPPDDSWVPNNAALSLADGARSYIQHQSCDSVAFLETALTSHAGWAVYLDEMLRLVKPHGILEILLVDTNFASIFEVMRRVFLWSGYRAFVSGRSDTHRGVHFSINIGDISIRRISHDSLDIVAISDGLNIKRAINIIESSINRIDSKVCVNVILDVSFLSDEYKQLACKNVSVVESKFKSQDISLRKMFHVMNSGASDNVLIIHDRYSLHENFLDEFSLMDGDFDVLICRQLLRDGTRFPDLVTTGSQLRSSRASILAYDDWSPFVYVNGGAILAKRDTLRRIPLNPMLSWGEREDVEWTSRLRGAGIEPRFCPCLALYSEEPRQGYLESFEHTRSADTFYMLPGGAEDAIGRHLPKLSSQKFRAAGRSLDELSACRGLHFSNEWRATSSGLQLVAGAEGRVCARVNGASNRETTTVRLHFKEYAEGVHLKSSENCHIRLSKNSINIDINTDEATSADYFDISIQSPSDLTLSSVSIGVFSTRSFRRVFGGLLARLR